MALNSTTAKQICTTAEFQLFTESLQKNITSLDERAVKSRITRARKMRDKYRQTANRQDRESRGKQKPRRRNPSQGSIATRKKEQLFSESLARFEKRLEKLESDRRAAEKKAKTTSRPKMESPEKPAKQSAVQKKAGAKVKRTPGKRTKSAVTSLVTKAKKKTRKKAAATAKKTRFEVSGATRKQKHRSADNKRRQARRDSK
jgi:hypothetical protein